MSLNSLYNLISSNNNQTHYKIIRIRTYSLFNQLSRINNLLIFKIKCLGIIYRIIILIHYYSNNNKFNPSNSNNNHHTNSLLNSFNSRHLIRIISDNPCPIQHLSKQNNQ